MVSERLGTPVFQRVWQAREMLDESLAVELAAAGIVNYCYQCSNTRKAGMWAQTSPSIDHQRNSLHSGVCKYPERMFSEKAHQQWRSANSSVIEPNQGLVRQGRSACVKKRTYATASSHLSGYAIHSVVLRECFWRYFYSNYTVYTIMAKLCTNSLTSTHRRSQGGLRDHAPPNF